jgi:hypothetical protein
VPPPIRATLALLVISPELELDILGLLIGLANAAEDSARSRPSPVSGSVIWCRVRPRDVPESHSLRATLLRVRLAPKHTTALPGGAEHCFEPAAGVDLPSNFWVIHNRKLPLTEEFAVEIQPLALQLLVTKAGVTI